ncbi:MAG: PRC-barrel domain-containing protein [Alsobacter sp.]
MTVTAYNTGEANARGLPIDETRRLIASDWVEGTSVYAPDGASLGTVHNFMVDKTTGMVACAVLSFGGFLGLGERDHPLPRKKQTYDTTRGGYVVEMTKEERERAPSFTAAETPWSNPNYGRVVYDFYRVPFYM